jgi:plastocyanin
MKRTLVLVAFLGACTTGSTGSGAGSGSDASSGSGSGSADAAVDAPPAVSHVKTVTCPVTPAPLEVHTQDANMRYDPINTNIAVGGVVKFVMSPLHDVKPNPIAPLHDSGTEVDFGATTCLEFDAPGTYGIYCSTHSFAGTITVQ